MHADHIHSDDARSGRCRPNLGSHRGYRGFSVAMTTMSKYREGSRTALLAALGLGFVLSIVLFVLLLMTPVITLLNGRRVSSGDTIVVLAMVVGIVAEVVAIRVIGRVDVPISIEPGLVDFPSTGTRNVLLRRTIALPTTHF